MPDYKTGTYIIKAKKTWQCDKCWKEIVIGESCFARVKEYGDQLIRSSDGEGYHLKDYKRFHLICAKKLPDLNIHEQALLQKSKVELNSAYGKASKTTDFALNMIKKTLKELEEQGYKVAYMDTELIFLKKTP